MNNFDLADEYIKLYGNLTIYDVKQLFCINSKNIKNYNEITKYLDNKYDFTESRDTGADNDPLPKNLVL